MLDRLYKMVVGGLDITDLYIRARQVDPNAFEQKTFKTIRLAPGIKAIIGRKPGEKTTSVQSVLFDKTRFTPKQAKEWLDKHNSKFSDALNLEDEKTSLFESSIEDNFNQHLAGHLPPLTPTQIQKLVELVGIPDDGEDIVPSEASFGVSRFVKKV